MSTTSITSTSSRTIRFGPQAQLVGIWCLPVWMVVFMTGWFAVAHFLPPHDPAAGAEQIATIFHDNSLRIRLGMYILMYSALLQIPFGAVVAAQIARLEGHKPHFLAYGIVISIAGQVLTITFPAMIWATAAFRPNRSADLVLAISDLGWISLIGMTVPLMAMPLTVAAAGFMDQSADPLFPRWLCWVSLAAATLLVPSGFVIFFQSGPFAWNGIFGYWVPVFDNFVWYIAMFVVIRRAILKQLDAERLEEAGAV